MAGDSPQAASRALTFLCIAGLSHRNGLLEKCFVTKHAVAECSEERILRHLESLSDILPIGPCWVLSSIGGHPVQMQVVICDPIHLANSSSVSSVTAAFSTTNGCDLASSKTREFSSLIE
ncbi:hypothetical protein RB3665 [Rhodopirellula baltica SH 1]|uniref:Uncharacterized protein n=1 Tax=Rhodopirellula baltica (strain DSM 10527 / NCIMB 13988 / SH1) TaxID=243090 RepID=Q7UTV1_RHOBA|nr:hypothetical protein RB3665 [Rhodopirellula baltica SH 1]